MSAVRSGIIALRTPLAPHGNTGCAATLRKHGINPGRVPSSETKGEHMSVQTQEIWRIFTMPDGKSSMEKLQLSLEPQGSGWSSKRLDGPGAVFKKLPHGMQAKWHTAPRRQMGYTVFGEGEIETGDGQKLVVKPGVITLLEDLSGQGHLTRGHGSVDRLVVFVAVSDDVKIA